MRDKERVRSDRRSIVISDIHGCYDEFCRLLELTAYKPAEDNLLLLGDYVDRGPASRQVVEMIAGLSRSEGVYVLRGNHDQRFVDLFDHPSPELIESFFAHGGKAALASYEPNDRPPAVRRPAAGGGFSVSALREALDDIRSRFAHHLALLRSTLLYAEDDERIYVHAGLDPAFRDWKKQPKRTFFSIRGPFLTAPTVVDKLVVFGHTPVSKLHDSSDVWFGGDKIGIDGGCSMGGRLNALIAIPGEPLRIAAVAAGG